MKRYIERKRRKPMAYEAPAVGTILPAKKNTTVQNPGAVHSPHGNDEWLQAQAQNTAFENNIDLIEEWHNAQENSPEYAQRLGADFSWAVKVAEAEAGGVDFQQYRGGPPVSTLG